MSGQQRPDRDVERRIADWMAGAAASRPPDGVLEEVRARVAATRQARRWPGWLRSLPGGPGPRALVLVPILLGAAALGALGIAAGQRGPTPSPSPSAVPTPGPLGAGGFNSPLPLSSGTTWPCADQPAVQHPGAAGLRSAGTPSVALAVGPTADDVVAGFGSVWISSAAGGQVFRVDPATGRPQAAIPIPTQSDGSSVIATTPRDVWVAEVWASGRGAGLLRIDPATNSVAGPFSMASAFGMAGDAEALWTSDWESSRLLRLDPSTGRELSRVDLTQGPPGARAPLPSDVEPMGVAVGSGRVWVTGTQSGEVIGVDASAGRVATRTCIEPEQEVWDVALGLGSVWAIAPDRGELLRLDAATGRLVARIPLPEAPDVGTLAARPLIAAGRVWVPDGAAVWSVDPAVNRVDGAVALSSVTSIAPSTGAGSIAEAGGSLWTENGSPGQLIRIALP